MTADRPTGSALGRLVGPASVGRYALIGVSGIALDTILFVVLISSGVQPVPATALSTLAGIMNNYVLNARLNFQTGFAVSSAARFLTVGLLGLVVAAVSLQLLIEQVGLSPVPAKLLSLPCVLVAQFLANKYWTFRA